MSEIHNGKKIYEIDDLVGNLKDDAFMPISQDNITRKIKLKQIRTFINGDNDEASDDRYFSSNKIVELFGDNTTKLNDINNKIVSINTRIDNLTNTVSENYNTLDTRITNEVNTLNGRIDTEVNTLNSRITNEVNTLNSRINTEVNTLNGRISSEVNTLNEKIKAEVNTINSKISELDKKLEGWILYGTAVPTTTSLPDGRLYIQYF